MRAVCVLLLVLLPLRSSPASGAPQAELWARWQAHDDASAAVIDHGAWNRFLHDYVGVGADGIARIPYARVATADRDALAADLPRLSKLPISRYSRREQFAFWVDLYNELTVKVVLDHYPVASIMQIGISPGLFSFGPWGRKLITIEGEPLSLDDIEHRILRPIWRDPRIHYAVNCAALGCRTCSPRRSPGPIHRSCSKRRHATMSTIRAAPQSRQAGLSCPRFISGTRRISGEPRTP